MIELYRPVDCPACADIETALREMVVAHRIIMVEANQTPVEFGPNIPLPALKENGQLVYGAEAIAAYMRELERFVVNWRRFQSDSCYIDDDGQMC
ncbi:MAG: hypothetical protein U0401_03745 [Anaerolineae bacterium]